MAKLVAKEQKNADESAIIPNLSAARIVAVQLAKKNIAMSLAPTFHTFSTHAIHNLRKTSTMTKKVNI